MPKPKPARAAVERFWSFFWLFGLPVGLSVLFVLAAHGFGWIDAVAPWHVLAAFAVFEMVVLGLRDRMRSGPPSEAPQPTQRARIRESAASIGIAVAVALFFRAFVVEAYEIPSGSMIPTLEVGDHVFVNKFVLGVQIPWTTLKLFEHVREPRRGEVIVFRHPRESAKDLIKRVVGIAGDEIEMRGTQLYLNGRPVRRCFVGEYSHEHRRSDVYVEYSGGIPHVALYDRDRDRWDVGFWRVESEREQESLPSPRGRSDPVCGVAAPPNTARYSSSRRLASGATSAAGLGPGFLLTLSGEVFVMGDNRDDSSDSRYWGGVPLGHIKGRAMFIWWSNAPATGVRVDRIGRSMGEPEIAGPLQAKVRRCLD